LNWKTFFALLARDAHVARRNLVFSLLQNLLQPMLLTFVFGRILTTSGMMNQGFKNVLLPGVIGTSMVMSGVWAVAMPLIAEFQFTREIEDRLLAPIDIGWIAVEKVIAGMIQALVAGFVVIPTAWLVMGSGVDITFHQPVLFLLICFLVALFAASGGLALGCAIGQAQVGLMFSLVVAPMIMFGCAYYPWAALKNFPGLQYAVLINPLVYASEGLRGVLVPGVPHIPIYAVIGALVAINMILLVVGMKRFYSKSIG
jgi:ABC-2 type transport system permease protein